MSAYLACVWLDVRLQSRARLYVIGIGVAVVTGVLVRALFPAEWLERALVAFLFLSTGGTTLLFGASMVLLERSEGTLLALRTSPLEIRHYLTSKVVTLTAFAVVESLVIYVVGAAPLSFAPLPLVLGLVLLNLLYALAGMALVAPHDNMTSFLMPSGLIAGAVLQMPAFWLIDVGPPELWYLFPSQAPLLLLLGAFEPLEPWQWAYALGVVGLATPLAIAWATQRFARHLGLRRRQSWSR